eukprot:1319214-Prymnesium_polylepis.1
MAIFTPQNSLSARQISPFSLCAPVRARTLHPDAPIASTSMCRVFFGLRGGLGLGVAVDRRAARPECPAWGLGHRPVGCGAQPASDRHGQF